MDEFQSEILRFISLIPYKKKVPNWYANFNFKKVGKRHAFGIQNWNQKLSIGTKLVQKRHTKSILFQILLISTKCIGTF